MKRQIVLSNWQLLDTGPGKTHKTAILAARKKTWWSAVKKQWKDSGGIKSIPIYEALVLGTRAWRTGKKVAERNALLTVIPIAINRDPALKTQLEALQQKGYTDLEIDKHGNIVAVKRRPLKRATRQAYNLRRSVLIKGNETAAGVLDFAARLRNGLPYDAKEAVGRAQLNADVEAEMRRLGEAARRTAIQNEARRRRNARGTP